MNYCSIFSVIIFALTYCVTASAQGDLQPESVVKNDSALRLSAFEYLSSREPLQIVENAEVEKAFAERVEEVIVMLERKYGLKAGEKYFSVFINPSFVWGSIQFIGEYKAALKEDFDNSKKALALDVLINIEGNKVYAHENIGHLFDDGRYSWNVDDEGHYVGCELLHAFDGPNGIELFYRRSAPESIAVGMFFICDGKLIQQVYEVYNSIGEE